MARITGKSSQGVIIEGFNYRFFFTWILFLFEFNRKKKRDKAIANNTKWYRRQAERLARAQLRRDTDRRVPFRAKEDVDIVVTYNTSK